MNNLYPSKKSFLFVTIIIAFLLFQPFSITKVPSVENGEPVLSLKLEANIASASCYDVCSISGYKRCTDTGTYQTCGDYDSDSCLEWSSSNSCGSGERCEGGQCVESCFNLCSYAGSKRCSDSTHYQTCGNYDSDSCLEWSYENSCGSGERCEGGQCVESCYDLCSSGDKRCSGSNQYKVCGNYDSDSCLEWSSARSCIGETYRGYGRCNENERPSWYCSGGNCDYNCHYVSPSPGHDYKSCYNNDVYWYDSNNNREEKYEECGSDYCNSWGETYCRGNSVYEKRTCYDKGCSNTSCFSDSYMGKRKVESCSSNETCRNGECVQEYECTSGSCCEDGEYENSNKICKVDVDYQYGCPWGTSCGNNVGKRSRVRYRYCSGNSSSCTGEWSDWKSWGNWKIADSCASQEVCKVGNNTCKYSSACETPSYYKHSYKACHNNDLYWYDSNHELQEKYKGCDDNNSCTLDSCSDNECVNELKCDGSTCTKGSSDYCNSCDTCGDGICNCGEDPCACREDCGASAALLTQKVKTQNTSWLNEITVKPGETLTFSVNVYAAGVEALKDVEIETELPSNMSYEDNLKINGNPSIKGITKGIVIDEVAFGKTKTITFNAKVNSLSENSSFVVTSARYDKDRISQSVTKVKTEESNIVEGLKAGVIFSYLKRWQFWLGLIAAIIIILILRSFYRSFRRREE